MAMNYRQDMKEDRICNQRKKIKESKENKLHLLHSKLKSVISLVICFTIQHSRDIEPTKFAKVSVEKIIVCVWLSIYIYL